MSNIKKVIRIIKLNWWRIAEFQLIYRMLSVLVFAPLLTFLFNISIKMSGYKYITVQNISSYIKNPVTIILIVFTIILTSFFTMIEISANIYIIDQSYQKVCTNIREVLKYSFSNAIRAFNYKNIHMSIIITSVALLMNIVLSTGSIGTVIVPDFLFAYILANKTLRHSIIGIAIVAIILLIRWIYAFHYFLLENCNFNVACLKSSGLNKNKKLKDSVLIVAMLLFFAISIGVIFLFIIFLLTEVYKICNIVDGPEYLLYGVIVVTSEMMLFIFGILVIPLLYTCISVLFYKHKVEASEEIIHTPKTEYISRYDERSLQRKYLKKIDIVVLIVAVIVCVVNGFGDISGNLKIEYLNTPDITAHRGASKKYPENTMSAFKGAAKQGADWIELDVQQTKDGEIIVMHDASLKRTTGVNKKVWQLTYDEILELDCGSWFSEKFKGEVIPRFADIIEYADDKDLMLNVELKPTGHEKNFEQQVIDIINEHDFTDNCVVTSQTYSSLKKVKKIDNNITTVYVMGVAYGDILKFKAADNFSIKSYYVNEQLVNKIHNAGKEIYVWTVNKELEIDNMMTLGVDNIITDNVPLATKCLYKRRTSNVVVGFVEKLL